MLFTRKSPISCTTNGSDAFPSASTNTRTCASPLLSVAARLASRSATRLEINFSRSAGLRSPDGLARPGCSRTCFNTGNGRFRRIRDRIVSTGEGERGPAPSFWTLGAPCCPFARDMSPNWIEDRRGLVDKREVRGMCACAGEPRRSDCASCKNPGVSWALAPPARSDAPDVVVRGSRLKPQSSTLTSRTKSAGMLWTRKALIASMSARGAKAGDEAGMARRAGWPPKTVRGNANSHAFSTVSQ